MDDVFYGEKVAYTIEDVFEPVFSGVNGNYDVIY